MNTWDLTGGSDMSRVKLEDLPHGARVMGLAPIGVRWWATWDKHRQRMKPDGNCPAGEFAALEWNGLVLDIPGNENYIPYTQ